MKKTLRMLGWFTFKVCVGSVTVVLACVVLGLIGRLLIPEMTPAQWVACGFAAVIGGGFCLAFLAFVGHCMYEWIDDKWDDFRGWRRVRAYKREQRQKYQGNATKGQS